MSEIPSEYGPATPAHVSPPKRRRIKRRILGWALILAPVALFVSNPVLWILAIPAFLPLILAGSFILYVAEPNSR